MNKNIMLAVKIASVFIDMYPLAKADEIFKIIPALFLFDYDAPKLTLQSSRDEIAKKAMRANVVKNLTHYLESVTCEHTARALLHFIQCFVIVPLHTQNVWPMAALNESEGLRRMRDTDLKESRKKWFDTREPKG